MTTTKQIRDVLSNNLLQIEKAEVYYKTSREMDIITDSFLENFQFLCESGCFVDCVGWHYEKDYKTDDYIIETGRYNPHSEIIITAYMNVCEGISNKDVESILLIDESED